MNTKKQLKKSHAKKKALRVLKYFLLLLFLGMCWGCSREDQQASCEFYDETLPDEMATPRSAEILDRARSRAKSGPFFLRVRDEEGKPLAGVRIKFVTPFLKEDKFATRIFEVKTGKDGYAVAQLENAVEAAPIEVVPPEGFQLVEELPREFNIAEAMDRNTPVKFIVKEKQPIQTDGRFMFNAAGMLNANVYNAFSYNSPDGEGPKGEALNNLKVTYFAIDVINGSVDEPDNPALPRRGIEPTLTIQCYYRRNKHCWELVITGMQPGGKVQKMSKWRPKAPDSGWEDAVTLEIPSKIANYERFVAFKTQQGQYGFLYLKGFGVPEDVFQAAFSAWLNPYGDKCLVPGRFGKLDNNYGLFTGFYVADGKYRQYAGDPWVEEKELKVSPNYEPEWLKKEIAKRNEQCPDDPLTPDQKDYNKTISTWLMFKGGDWRIPSGLPWGIVLSAVQAHAQGKIPKCPDFAGMVEREEFILEPELYKKVLQVRY